MSPTDDDRELAKQIVSLVLRDEEAAWEPVAKLLAAYREQHRHEGEVAEIRRAAQAWDQYKLGGKS